MTFLYIAGSDHSNRREKRRRLGDSGQTDEYEQNSTFSSLSLSNLSNRVTATTSTNPSRRLSPPSTPSISLSSPEDEPAALSTKSYRTNDDQTNPSDSSIQRPSSSASLDQLQQRKRHQRKPLRGKSIPLHPSMTIPVKDEPGETDDNSVPNDEHESALKKKPGLLLTTGGNSSADLLHDPKSSVGNSSTYKWLHQAFRSLIPPQSQTTDLELTMQQNASSPTSSKQTVDSSFSCSSSILFSFND